MAGKLPRPQPGCCASLTALWLPRLCHSRSCIASGVISGLTFQSSIREQVARDRLLPVFKTAAPEELLPEWTTSVLALFNCLCFSPSLLSPVCIIFLT